MRQLISSELLDKFKDYTSDIKYTSFQDLDVKFNQLFNFLFEQDIAKRVLERISEDFYLLKESISIESHKRNHRFYVDIINSINTRETQGAFGYFIMLDKFNVERKNSNHYIESTREWYRRGTNYNEYKDNFDTYFFVPFIELFEWYLQESETIKDHDYFSFETQNVIFEKLDKLEFQLTQQGFGQQIIFEEIEDVKKLAKKLNKKNWNEIIMGKFFDLALDKIISVDLAQKIIKLLTEKGINLLQ